VAERRIRYPLLWLAFSALMVTGAAMLLSRSPAVQAWGLAVLVAPIVVFSAVALAYFVLERFRA
jgi:hypothetical protein